MYRSHEDTLEAQYREAIYTRWYGVNYQLDDFHHAQSYWCKFCEAEERTHDFPGASIHDIVMAIEHYEGCIVPLVLKESRKAHKAKRHEQAKGLTPEHGGLSIDVLLHG